jgi:hypothetical protein
MEEDIKNEREASRGVMGLRKQGSAAMTKRNANNGELS